LNNVKNNVKALLPTVESLAGGTSRRLVLAERSD